MDSVEKEKKGKAKSTKTFFTKEETIMHTETYFSLICD